MIKKGWSLIVLLIVIGVLFQMFVDTIRPLMIYIIGGVAALGFLALLFFIGRAIYIRRTGW